MNLSTVSVRDMQEEVGDWLKRNFGEAPATDQCLIISEEVGELCHHVLKMKQGIRKNEDHEAGVQDAVADIVIGVMAFCSQWDIDLEDLLCKTWNEVKQRDWTKETAK